MTVIRLYITRFLAWFFGSEPETVPVAPLNPEPYVPEPDISPVVMDSPVEPPEEVSAPPDEASELPALQDDAIVREAVRRAYVFCGLNAAAFEGGYDLAAAGKLQEVLHHAAYELALTHPVRTVDQVVALLMTMR